MRRTALAPAPRPQKRTMARFCPPLPRPLAWATAARGAAARALSSLSPSRGLIPLKNISDFKDPRVEKSQGQKFRRTDIVATGKFIGWENQVSRPRIHKSRDCSASPVPQTTCADCVGSSGDLPPPSPPAENGAGNLTHVATRDSVVETEPFVSGSRCASVWAYAWQQSPFSADLFQSSRSSRFWWIQSARASQSPSYSLRSFALELRSVPHRLLPIFGGWFRWKRLAGHWINGAGFLVG